MANFAEYHSKKKSMPIALLLWLFFGGIGLHRFYLGSNAYGLCLLLMPVIVIGSFSIEPDIGIWITVGYTIAVLVDVIWVFSMVHHYNRDLAAQLTPNKELETAGRVGDTASSFLNPKFEELETKACPDCAEEVKAAAKKCRFCGFEFEDV